MPDNLHNPLDIMIFIFTITRINVTIEKITPQTATCSLLSIGTVLFFFSLPMVFGKQIIYKGAVYEHDIMILQYYI